MTTEVMAVIERVLAMAKEDSPLRRSAISIAHKFSFENTNPSISVQIGLPSRSFSQSRDLRRW